MSGREGERHSGSKSFLKKDRSSASSKSAVQGSAGGNSMSSKLWYLVLNT